MNVLPKGWKLTRFDEFITRINRKVMIDDTRLYKCVGVRWYGMGAFVREEIPGVEISRKQQWVLRADDIVYNKLFAWKGAFALADTSVDGFIVSDKFPTYSINLELVAPRFLSYYFRTPQLANQARELSKGAAAISKLTLNPPQFLDLTIPLPSLRQQERTVARIEALSTQLQKVRALRQQAGEEAKGLVDSTMNRILSQATSKTWEYGAIPEFADVNPSRAGRIKLMQRDLVSFVPMKAVDGATGTIVCPEIRTFAEVSKGYTWFTEGDVIFARITPCMQNGKSAIARGLRNGTAFGSTEFHVIRPGLKLTAEWLHALVRHKAFRDDASAHFKGTAGQQRVPQSFLEKKTIPVPSLSEQGCFVAELDALNAEVNALKCLQAETAVELDALSPSILDQAFKGEL